MGFFATIRSMTSEDETAAKVVSAIATLQTDAMRGTKEYGDAHAFLFKLLEKELREWVKEHPPGSADYTVDTPDRAVYLYSDELDPALAVHTIKDILYTHMSHFGKLVKRTIQSLKSSSKKSEKDIVAAKFPEYPELCKEIREAKKAWNAEDAAIKKTHAFRMMGGLARLGSHSGANYRHLVEKAQRMERQVLGRELTKYVRASG